MAADVTALQIATPLMLGGMLSFFVELLLKPRPCLPWQRPPSAVLLHMGTWSLLFFVELVLLRRPCLAALNVLALQLFLVLISNAKYQSLREPFIFQDFSYFVAAVRHPRLYLPFLGFRRALVALSSVTGVLSAGLILEQPFAMVLYSWATALQMLILLALAVLLILSGNRHMPPVSLKPEDDLERLGLIAALWCYGREERKPWTYEGATLFRSQPVQRESEFPNLLVIQSESFFDPRRMFSGVHPGVMENFDLLRSEAHLQGRLEVPAWGANTVRTEFAFLAGCNQEQLGIHRFNPYRRVARQGIPTLAWFLKRLGYRTVCLHPYPASFYSRDEVYPLLGFDEFLDIRQFSAPERSGPYIGDEAVAAKVCQELGSHAGGQTVPLFLFVITMENHGPLHWEQVHPGDQERLYMTPPPAGCEDLTVYLRHLAQADRMFGRVRSALESAGREGWICLFGDHLPIMPEVYRKLGRPDGAVDYVVWSTDTPEIPGSRMDLPAERLAAMMLQKMELAGNGV
jgi:phosphoglycerol transferase MdoB-like AlkP superfamily enzyme